MNENATLLPAGFRDVLPPQVGQETKVLAATLRCFEQWGYEQVKPPLVEFTAPGDASLARQTFQMTDPDSGERLTLRADITPQVARMAALRLKDAPRPLRLSYNGQVLRARGEGLHAERQLAQAGAELIGEAALAADAEVVQLAIEALHKVGLKDICVDFSIPQLQAILLKKPSAELAELIEKKDVSGITAQAGDAGALLAELIAAAGDAGRVFTRVAALKLPEAAQACFAQLAKLVETVRASGTACQITVDPLERKGFEYHTGIAFSFFVKGSVEELGRGGRYALPGTGEDAVGFSLNMNNLLRALPEQPAPERIYVPYGESTEALRAEGRIVLQGLTPTADPKTEAKRLRCTHVLVGGKAEML